MALSVVTRGFTAIGSIARVVLRGYFSSAVVEADFKVLTLNPRVLNMTAETRSLTQTLNPRVLTLTVPEE